MNLEGELGDMKLVVGWVVTEKGLMARILGMGWGITGDSSGNCIDKQLASLDIRTGGKGTRARKGTLDHRDDDVMGGSKLG